MNNVRKEVLSRYKADIFNRLIDIDSAAEWFWRDGVIKRDQYEYIHGSNLLDQRRHRLLDLLETVDGGYLALVKYLRTHNFKELSKRLAKEGGVQDEDVAEDDERNDASNAGRLYHAATLDYLELVPELSRRFISASQPTYVRPIQSRHIASGPVYAPRIIIANQHPAAAGMGTRHVHHVGSARASVALSPPHSVGYPASYRSIGAPRRIYRH